MYALDPVVLGAFNIAQSKCLESRHSEITAEHLLLGLISNKSSFLSKSLSSAKNELEKIIQGFPQLDHINRVEDIKPSSSLNKWLTLAGASMAEAGETEIKEAHLIKHIPKVLSHLNLDLTKLKGGETTSEDEMDFLVNLNDLANQGKLDPVIGRHKEVRALMEILGRRSKNNPILVGAAGVGKTAIVEGLADKIVKDQVPDVLKGKTIYSLDLGMLMAGTKYRGEFEKKLKKLINFFKEQNGEAILFIDEVHQLVGAGRTDGAMDAANLLKPALARGELHTIGATTQDEYKKYILGDQALERRFRSVYVGEPGIEDTVEILLGLKEKHEMHHGIKITDDALYAAAKLSEQYITDKNQPDKSIDLVDEAASSLKLMAETMPSELVELQAELRSKNVLLQIEKNKKGIKEEIEKLEEQFKLEKEKWEKQTISLKKLSELKNQRDRMLIDLEKAEREQNYEDAGKIKYSLLPEIEAQLQEIQHDWVLGPEHIAQVISRQINLPVEKILKTKQDNILHLEEYLNQRVFGQSDALREITETVQTSFAGLKDSSKPMGSFLLLGPTGVGKTETAKTLAEFLFNNEKQMVRFDMSEFSEKHSVAKLIGAPAGYVGYDEGGVLTEAIRKRPYSIILFDEIEKAHSDFSDILLQILDDGRLTDNKGRTVNFKNTIILLTSNSKNPETDFKPEVLGRIDSVLYYQSLSKDVMVKLINKELALLNERLKEKNIEVKLSEHLISILEDRGYSESYGARPLSTVFQKFVIRPLSKKLLDASLNAGEYTLDFKDGDLKILKNEMA
jgi:ATP-dependent Clp protease ATP-binding subunit ClpB